MVQTLDNGSTAHIKSCELATVESNDQIVERNIDLEFEQLAELVFGSSTKLCKLDVVNSKSAIALSFVQSLVYD